MMAWKEYGMFAIIGILCLVLMPPLLTPYLGGVFGAYTTYAVTGIVLVFALWVHKKIRGDKS